jgi:hypothetical protein
MQTLSKFLVPGVLRELQEPFVIFNMQDFVRVCECVRARACVRVCVCASACVTVSRQVCVCVHSAKCSEAAFKVLGGINEKVPF